MTATQLATDYAIALYHLWPVLAVLAVLTLATCLFVAAHEVGRAQ